MAVDKKPPQLSEREDKPPLEHKMRPEHNLDLQDTSLNILLTKMPLSVGRNVSRTLCRGQKPANNTPSGDLVSRSNTC
uniref:Uncharacterized protein n=1 Tax=Timema genevievae TaxID=629358 RepID=A0A7R9K0A0_TIMGE|nr:unnamed protein product [Timema genevievae]